MRMTKKDTKKKADDVHFDVDLAEDDNEELLTAEEIIIAQNEELASDNDYDEETLESLSKQEEYEFVCEKCFFIRNNSMKADPNKNLCVNCVK